jgi:hypothetical protein
VERLEDRHEVVAPREGRIAGVASGDGDALGQPSLRDIGAGESDRGLVRVEAVDPHLGIGTRHGNARPGGAASHIGDPSRRIAAETRVNVDNGGQPLRAQQLQKSRPVLPRLSLAWIGPEGAPRDPLAAAKRLEQRGQRAREPHHQLDDGGEPIEAVGIEQHLGMLGGQ